MSSISECSPEKKNQNTKNKFPLPSFFSEEILIVDYCSQVDTLLKYQNNQVQKLNSK